MMGEAIAATQLATLFARTGTPLQTLENRFLSWENLRRENHVLLGGDAENHWVNAILERCPFRINTPADGSARRIINTSPSAGEPASYRVVGTEETREEYALISMVQGLTSAHEFLVICGLNSPATPLAAEYLTTDSGMQQLIRALRKAAPKHAGAWHFQAIVKVDLATRYPPALRLPHSACSKTLDLRRKWSDGDIPKENLRAFRLKQNFAARWIGVRPFIHQLAVHEVAYMVALDG